MTNCVGAKLKITIQHIAHVQVQLMSEQEGLTVVVCSLLGWFKQVEEE